MMNVLSYVIEIPGIQFRRYSQADAGAKVPVLLRHPIEFFFG